jgi:5,10-methylene-tetrahydrofolate dehydrogenase/methenyl tetrahydrofolate cyclohydrolase
VPLFDALPRTAFDPGLWVDGKKLMGKKLAELLRHHIKEETAKTSLKPGLAVILVGADAASQIYVAGKEKAALELGFDSRIVRLPARCDARSSCIAEIHRFNLDANLFTVFLFSLPLPAHLNESQILQAIVAEKDADGFHYLNQGKLAAGIAATSAVHTCRHRADAARARCVKIGLHHAELDRPARGRRRSGRTYRRQTDGSAAADGP